LRFCATQQVILVNFRKEIQPFVPKAGGDHRRGNEEDGDCSDVLLVSDSAAIAAHNEDGGVALLGHTYIVRATLPDGLSFTAYTYAGELPTCAFGFNSNGVVCKLLIKRNTTAASHSHAIAPPLLCNSEFEARKIILLYSSGIHVGLGPAAERRDRRRRRCPELRVEGPARGEEPRRRNARTLPSLASRDCN
jgi:hypothetical protein